MDRIQVLMSTYNGEKYLREQIDSILEQDCEKKKKAKVQLLVRDDGSKDGTQQILEEYAQRYPDTVRWYQGENVGVIKSFFDLVMQSDDEAKYYAFADQDDFWMSDKLGSGIIALEKMQEERKPNLYCCRPLLVDEKLEEIPMDEKRFQVHVAFENALIENVVVGCTMVMNQSLRDMVKENCPNEIMMHDRWFYMLATCFGQIYYDKTPHIKYRQHGNNQVGMDMSLVKEFRERVTKVKQKSQAISAQVKEFQKIYGVVLKEEAFCIEKEEAVRHLMLVNDYVESLNSFAKRCKLISSGRLYRQRKMDNLFFKILFLLGFFS